MMTGSTPGLPPFDAPMIAQEEAALPGASKLNGTHGKGESMMARQRLRDLGFHPGVLDTGRHNAITDVAGVRVGHRTISSADGGPPGSATGVTAVIPAPGNLSRAKLRAASHVINGFGKTAGLMQLDELGEIEAPIFLTNTLAVGAVLEGGVRYMLERDRQLADAGPCPNIIVGECNDGYLNDLRSLFVRPEDAIQAALSAAAGPVEEGAVGGGTGMATCGWKGGIGTSSRRVPGTSFTVGVLVQSNFGAAQDLVILGVPVGRHLRPGDFTPGDGSIIIVVATDLPWDALSLRRLASRTAMGVARLGSVASHGSGDVAIAFSTAAGGAPAHADGGEVVTAAFHAVVEATEEAVLNALFMADTTAGRQGRVLAGVPVDDVVRLLRASGVA